MVPSIFAYLRTSGPPELLSPYFLLDANDWMVYGCLRRYGWLITVGS